MQLPALSLLRPDPLLRLCWVSVCLPRWCDYLGNRFFILVLGLFFSVVV
jgi:hypothetical protein